MPFDWNVMPLSVETNTSFVLPVVAVPIQTVPSGPMSSASIHTPWVDAAVVKLQPPSRLTRRPSNVVAKIVPSVAIAYFGSHCPP